MSETSQQAIEFWVEQKNAAENTIAHQRRIIAQLAQHQLILEKAEAELHHSAENIRLWSPAVRGGER